MNKRNPFKDIGSYSERKAQQQEKEGRSPDQRAATYRIGEDLIKRVNDAAEQHNVEKAGFVKALLTYALDQLEAGEWKLPIAGEARRKVDIR